MDSPLSIHGVHRATRLLDDSPGGDGRLRLDELRGRLVELAADRGHPQISFALDRIARAHRQGEPAAWIGSGSAPFWPPDADGRRIDWSALAILHLDGPCRAGRAAGRLLRSGGFGVIAVDLAAYDSPRLPSPLIGRLLRLTREHRTALLLLTEASESSPSLSPTVALRAHLRWLETTPERLRAEIAVVKDNHRGSGRCFKEEYDGPLGLR